MTIHHRFIALRPVYILYCACMVLLTEFNKKHNIILEYFFVISRIKASCSVHCHFIKASILRVHFVTFAERNGVAIETAISISQIFSPNNGMEPFFKMLPHYKTNLWPTINCLKKVNVMISPCLPHCPM